MNLKTNSQKLHTWKFLLHYRFSNLLWCLATDEQQQKQQEQHQHERFSSYDTVFESPTIAPMTSSENFMTSSTNNQVVIKVTKPTVASSTDGGDEEESEADESKKL